MPHGRMPVRYRGRQEQYCLRLSEVEIASTTLSTWWTVLCLARKPN